MNNKCIRTFLIAFVIAWAPTWHAHADSKQCSDEALNAVLITVGGAGPYLSINYERKFYSQHFLGKQMHMVARAGFGTSPFLFGNELSFPLDVSMLWGGRLHFFEIGLALTCGTLDQYNYISDRHKTRLRALLVPSVGYRFGNDNFIGSVLYSPVVNFTAGPPAHWLALSFGWGF